MSVSPGQDLPSVVRPHGQESGLTPHSLRMRASSALPFLVCCTLLCAGCSGAGNQADLTASTRDDPLIFDVHNQDISVTRTQIRAGLRAGYWIMHGPECGPLREDEYWMRAVDLYNGKDGYSYTFRSTRDPGSLYYVLLLPNIRPDASAQTLADDFFACDPGSYRPLAFSKDWVLLARPCDAGATECERMQTAAASMTLPAPSAPIAAVQALEVHVWQDGREISAEDGTVSLERRPFELHTLFPANTEVRVQAAATSTVADRVAAGETLLALPSLTTPRTLQGTADPSALFLSETGHQTWTMDDPSAFSSRTVTSATAEGVRSIQHLQEQAPSGGWTAVSLSTAPRDVYLTAMTLFPTREKELERHVLHLRFK